MNVLGQRMAKCRRRIPHLTWRALFCCAIMVSISTRLAAQIEYDLQQGNPLFVWNADPQCTTVFTGKINPHIFPAAGELPIENDGDVRVLNFDQDTSPITVDLPFDAISVRKVPNSQLILALELIDISDEPWKVAIWCINMQTGVRVWKRTYGVRGFDAWYGIAISSNGETLALPISNIVSSSFKNFRQIASLVFSSHIELIDMSSGKGIENLKCSTKTGICRLAFSPNGSLLAAGGTLGCSLSYWDLASGRERVVLENVEGTGMDGIRSVAFSPDGNLLVACGQLRHRRSSEGNSSDAGLLLVWNIEKDRLAMVAKSANTCFMDICFDRKGRYFITSEVVPNPKVFTRRPPFSKETILKLWIPKSQYLMAECRRTGEMMLMPLTTKDGEMITYSAVPFEEEHPLTMEEASKMLEKRPQEEAYRVERCEWTINFDDFVYP